MRKSIVGNARRTGFAAAASRECAGDSGSAGAFHWKLSDGAGISAVSAGSAWRACFAAGWRNCAAAGFSDTGREIPIARLVAIADNTSKATEVARNGAEWIVNSYLSAQHRPVMTHSFWSEGVDPIQRYLDEVILHGDEILRLREEIGLDYLLCAPLSHQTSNQSPHRAQHRRRQLSRALRDHDARRFRSRRHARRAPLDRTGRRGRAAPGDRARGRASSGHSRGPARDAAAARFVKSK